MTLTQEQLKGMLSYDPETGAFTCIKPMGRRRPGMVMGDIHHTGYRRIKLLGKEYKAHRLAWLYIYGCWPADQIDHINGVRDDNRIANLREANNAENQHNRHKLPRNNRSGYIGVCWCSESSKWRATIKVDGKNRRLGLFATPEEAHAAYLRAKARLHPTSQAHMHMTPAITGPSATF